MKLALLFLTLLFQLTPTPMPRQVTVTVLAADGQPVVGQVIQLVIQRPLVRQECLTDEAGLCLFTFTASGDLLNGYLLLVSRGQRSIIWKGEHLEVVIHLTANGELDIPTDFTGPPAPPIQTVLTETAVPATPLTIEFVPSTVPSQPSKTPTTAVSTLLLSTPEQPMPTAIPLIRPAPVSTFLGLLGAGMGLSCLLLVCAGGIFWYVRRRG